VRQAEAPPDEKATPEELFHLPGPRVGGDIEVLGLSAQKKIANTAPHQVGLEATAPDPRQYLEHLGIDRSPRHGVPVGREYYGIFLTENG
jgi:hypothetical protein